MPVIKARYNEQLRRLRVPNLSSIVELQTNLKSLFKATPLPNDFILKYRDEEGDWINLDTEEELQEALLLSKAGVPSSASLSSSFASTTSFDSFASSSSPTSTLHIMILDRAHLATRLAAATKSLRESLIKTLKQSVNQETENGKAFLDEVSSLVQKCFEKSEVDKVLVDEPPKQPVKPIIAASPPPPVPKPVVEPKVVEPVKPIVAASPPPPPPKPIVELPHDAEFSADITIPDGSIIVAGSSFTKTWRVKNSGPKQWPQGLTLKFLGGADMQAPEFISVRDAFAGEELDITVRLTAPKGLGQHQSFFRLCAPNGESFGDKLWVTIVAVAPAVAPQPVLPIVPPPQQPQHPFPVQPFPPHPHHPFPVQPFQHQPNPIAARMYPEPTAPKEPALVIPEQFREQVDILKGMGFKNVQRMLELLTKHKGDIQEIFGEELD